MTAQELQTKANQIREDVVKTLVLLGSGHPAGSLGMADIFTALYFGADLNLDPQNPWSEDRDRIILSAGHLCPAWYATLAHAGYFPREELCTLRKLHSRLQGHPHMRSIPGVENTAGSLGQGMSVAVGVALALRLKFSILNLKFEQKRIPRVICITSDAELQEGQAWEAAMCASKYHLDHLTFITDRNNIQISGYTEQVMPLEPLAEKIGSFGFHPLSVHGNDISDVLHALQFDVEYQRRPVWIIANTIPGKGVSFMEGMAEWHGKVPNDQGQVAKAIDDLRHLQTLGGRIKNES